MDKINRHLWHLMLSGWLGVILFFLAGFPEGGYQILDVKTSILITNYLKSSLGLSAYLYKFGSIDESYINVPIILSFICFAVSRLKGSKRLACMSIIGALIWVEFWIVFIINPLFSKISILDFNLIPEVGSWIVETKRITASNSSIVSKHVFAMFFYAGYCYNKDYKISLKVIIWFCALLFAIPPVLNAKHWLSDWLFSVWFTYSAIHLCKFLDLENKLYRLLQDK